MAVVNQRRVGDRRGEERGPKIVVRVRDEPRTTFRRPLLSGGGKVDGAVRRWPVITRELSARFAGRANQTTGPTL